MIQLTSVDVEQTATAAADEIREAFEDRLGRVEGAVAGAVADVATREEAFVDRSDKFEKVTLTKYQGPKAAP